MVMDREAWRAAVCGVTKSQAQLSNEFTNTSSFMDHHCQILSILSPKSRVKYLPPTLHGNPLQYSCLENLMDGGAWWAMLHRVTKRLDTFEATYQHSTSRAFDLIIFGLECCDSLSAGPGVSYSISFQSSTTSWSPKDLCDKHMILTSPCLKLFDGPHDLPSFVAQPQRSLLIHSSFIDFPSFLKTRPSPHILPTSSLRVHVFSSFALSILPAYYNFPISAISV